MDEIEELKKENKKLKKKYEKLKKEYERLKKEFERLNMTIFWVMFVICILMSIGFALSMP